MRREKEDNCLLTGTSGKPARTWGKWEFNIQQPVKMTIYINAIIIKQKVGNVMETLSDSFYIAVVDLKKVHGLLFLFVFTFS